MRRTPRRMTRNSSRMREHFMPPPVDPAQAPQNMMRMRISWENCGHSTKSAVAKPVVEIREATWKTVYRRLSQIPPYTPRLAREITRVVPATTQPKNRSSSLRRASRQRRVRIKKYTAKLMENSRMKTVIIISMARLL